MDVTRYPIETERLRLFAFAPEHLLALIESTPEFEARIGLRAANGLRNFIVSDDVSPSWLAQLRAAKAADPWIHGFAVVQRESGMVIGTSGFKGPPDESGVVEIAYGIVPDYEGRGYASEAAAAMVSFAFGNKQVHVVRAHTLPTSNASTRVLTKCGFEFIGQVLDPEDGPVWRWELAKPSN